MDASRSTKEGQVDELDGGPGPAEVAATTGDIESQSTQKYETGATLVCPRCYQERQGGHLLHMHLKERHQLGAADCYRLVGQAIGESRKQQKK
jgi:hypothetical protein